MDRNALDWLFSTSPQAIAALVGLILAGVSFIYGKIDDRIEADATLAEIGLEVKSRIHSRLKHLLSWTIGIIIVDLLCLFFNPMTSCLISSDAEWQFNVYIFIAVMVLCLNIGLLYKTVCFVKITMNPSFVASTIKDLSKDYNDKEQSNANVVEISDFIQHFIQLERILRKSDLFSDKKDNYHRPLPLSQMLRDLYNLKIISREDYHNIREINRIRNLILHGGDIQKIDGVIDSKLQDITNKIQIAVDNAHLQA